MSEETFVEPTEVEKQALELGWKPKEQFDESSGKKWRTAEEFMDRKPFFDKIEEGKREIKQLRSAVENLTKHNARIEQTAYTKALKELQVARADAVEEGNLKKVEAIRDEIDRIKQEAAQVVVPNTPPQEFLDWKDENPWYQSDETMTLYADALGQKLMDKGLAPTDIFKEVEKKVKENFPNKFRNPNKDAAPVVEPTKKTTKVSSVESTMTEEEKKIMNSILRVGGLTKEDYLKQFAAINQK